MIDYTKMTEGEALLSIGVRAVTQDGKKGIRLPNGIFIEASDEKPDCIVATNIALKFSKEVLCADCSAHIFISHNTQLMLLKYLGTPIICMECMVKRRQKEEADGKGK